MRQILEQLHGDFIGDTDKSRSDTELIVDILEELIKKVEELENHTHSIR